MIPKLALHAQMGAFEQIWVMSCLNTQSSYPNIGSENAKESVYTVLGWNFKTLTIWPLMYLCLAPVIHSLEQTFHKYFFIIEINIFHVKFNVNIKYQKRV